MATQDVSTAADQAAEVGRILVNRGQGWGFWGEGTRALVSQLNQNGSTDEGRGTSFRWEPLPQRTEH